MNILRSLQQFAGSTTDGKISPGNNSGFNLGIPTVSADATTVAGVLNEVYFWAGIVAVLVIVIAGIMFATGSGVIDKDGKATNVARAKKAIIGAVIGLIVVLMAYVITGVVLRVG